MNDQIYLLKSLGTFSGWTGTQLTYNLYTFDLTGNGTDLILVVVGIPPQGGPQPSIVRIRDVADTGYGINASTQACTINPFISSISASPIPGGATLFIDAWSGDGCILTFQWQVLQNGSWVDISGANEQSFTYLGLQPGTYTVRCIVRNNVGGEIISRPTTFIVP
jgi:hypothetical protein